MTLGISAMLSLSAIEYLSKDQTRMAEVAAIATKWGLSTWLRTTRNPSCSGRVDVTKPLSCRHKLADVATPTRT
jgi:hypothetical protein